MSTFFGTINTRVSTLFCAQVPVFGRAPQAGENQFTYEEQLFGQAVVELHK